MSVAWVGAGIAAVGAYSASQSQGKAEDRAINQQNLNEEERQQLRASEQATYDEWQSTYGALEDNLADYFNSVSAESYVIRGLENQQQAFETSMTRINESLAQRGITNTAIGASFEAQAELQGAEDRAKIRTVAPALAAQEKMSFLQLGLSQNQGRDYGGVPAIQPTQQVASVTNPISGSNGGDRDRPQGVNPASGNDSQTYAPVSDLVTGTSEPGYTTSSEDSGYQGGGGKGSGGENKTSPSSSASSTSESEYDPRSNNAY